MLKRLISQNLFLPEECSLLNLKREYYQHREILLIPFPSQGLVIPAYYFQVSSPPSNINIIYCYGNGETLCENYDFGKFLSQILHVNVVMFEYPGFGLLRDFSHPSEEICYELSECILRFLQIFYGAASRNVLFVGKDIGTGICVEMALRHPLAGIVLLYPIASAIRIVTRHQLSLSMLAKWDVFDNLKKMKHVGCRTLFFHGEPDTIIPSWHSRVLFQQTPPNLRYGEVVIMVNKIPSSRFYFEQQNWYMIVCKLNEFIYFLFPEKYTHNYKDTQ